MNRFLSSDIPSMEVEEFSLDDISMDDIKNSFALLTKDAPNLIHESRLAVKVSENEFTNFSERLRAEPIEQFQHIKTSSKLNL